MPFEPAKPFISRKEKYLRRLQARDEMLINRAAKSNDPLLYEVAYSLIKEFPGKVTKINEYLIDKLTKNRSSKILLCVEQLLKSKAELHKNAKSNF